MHPFYFASASRVLRAASARPNPEVAVDHFICQAVITNFRTLDNPFPRQLSVATPSRNETIKGTEIPRSKPLVQACDLFIQFLSRYSDAT